MHENLKFTTADQYLHSTYINVDLRVFWTTFHNLDLFKIIWTQPKQIGLVQNNIRPVLVVFYRLGSARVDFDDMGQLC